MGLKVRKNRAPVLPACPVTECMSLLGGAWTPHVIWQLRAGPRRFGELRIDIPLISAKVLSGRLRELESKGVVARRLMATSPPSAEYMLSELGEELVPAIDAIVKVGQKIKRNAQARPTRQRSERMAHAS